MALKFATTYIEDPILDLNTVLCLGLMIGKELCVCILVKLADGQGCCEWVGLGMGKVADMIEQGHNCLCAFVGG